MTAMVPIDPSIANLNPFEKPIDEYKRDLNVVKNYVETAAKHLALNTGKDIDICREYVQSRVDTDCKPVDRPMKALKRPDRGGDRKEVTVGFEKYLRYIQGKDMLMAPNMVAYCQPDVQKAMIVKFIEDYQGKRSELKKIQHNCKVNGDAIGALNAFLEQNNVKFYLNSISGATSVGGNPFYFGSLHTTLTSTCRAVTSYANAINEKMLGSNRHYHTPEVALANISYLIRTADLGLIRATMNSMGVIPPTVDYAYKVIVDSCTPYWRSEETFAQIRTMLENMDPAERAAVTFCGDLQSMMDVNGRIFRNFYKRLIDKPTVPHPDPDSIVKQAGEDEVSLVGILSVDFMAGIDPKDLKDHSEHLYGIYAARLQTISDTMREFAPIMRAFFITDHMPPEIHSFPTTIRKAVIASDTDSSIFTVSRQVKWFMGNEGQTPQHIAAAGVSIYLVSKVITHSLFTLCAQMGIRTDNIRHLKMKNEFYMPDMLVTTKTKHYLATEKVQEGMVFKEPDLIIKGVNLKSSKLPKYLREKMDAYYELLLKCNPVDNPLTTKELLAVPAYIEHLIREDILDRNSTFYRTEQVRPANNYKDPLRSVYRQYLLWEEVFAPKYGHVEVLPESFVSVSVTIDSKARTKAWVEALPPDTQARVKAFMEKYSIDHFTRFVVPPAAVKGGKIPEEILSVIDMEGMLDNLMLPFYIVLECCGIYLKDATNTRASTRRASDLLTKEEAAKHLRIEF